MTGNYDIEGAEEIGQVGQVKTDKSQKKKWIKRGVIGATALATIAGTYSARDGDFAPFYVRHTGDSYGISVGFIQQFDEGATHTGLTLSAYTLNRGKINGAVLGLVNDGRGTINGLELGVSNCHVQGHEEEKDYVYGTTNGIQIGILNNVRKSNGVQISIGNSSNDGNKLQVGLINLAEIYDAKSFQIGAFNCFSDEDKTEKTAFTSGSILFGWDFRDEKLQDK